MTDHEPLTLRRILTFWGAVFCFVLASGLLWTGFLIAVFWLTGKVA